MNFHKPFRTYLFSWSMAWYMILYGSALVYIPERFDDVLFRNFSMMYGFGVFMIITGVAHYLLLLIKVNHFIDITRKVLHVVTGAILASLGWYLMLNPTANLNIAGLPLIAIAIISTTLPFLRIRKKEKNYIDVSIVNLAAIGILLGLAIIWLPQEMINVDSLSVDSAYVKLFGIISLLASGLLIVSQIKSVSFQTKLLIHLVAILSLSLISLPSLLYPKLTSMEFLLIFLLTSSLTLYWDPKVIRGSLNSMQIQLLIILLAVAFTLLFFFIVITGQYYISPFTLTLYAFGSTMVASIGTTIITKPLRQLQTGAKQLLKKDNGFKPVKVTGPAEIRQLTIKFNQMGKVIVDSQKQLEKEIKQRTKELRANKNNLTQLLSRLKAILESTEEPLVAVNPEGSIIIFNNSMSNLTNYPIRDALGKQATKFLHLKDNEMKPISVIKSPMSIAIKEKRSVVNKFDEHYYLSDSKGNHIPITLTASPVIGPHHEILGAVCVIRDISLEKRLKDLQNEFVFVAAHELRNPVTAITGFVEYAREAKVRNKKVKTAINAIDEANQRLRKLINNLLQVARYESGQLNPSLKVVDFIKTIKDVVAEHKKDFKNNQLECNMSIDSKAGGVDVLADENFLHEILVNLIRNAIKYSDKKCTIDIRVLLSSRIDKIHKVAKKSKAAYAVFEVENKGYGIPKSEFYKVFSKFYRGSNVADIVAGNGLGLFIVKKLVEKMNGKIWFSSVEGGSTVFSISIPIAK